MLKTLSSLLFLAQANGAQGQPNSPSIFNMLIPFALMFVIMYVILIKPQHKKQKQHQEMVKKIKSGDRVVTNGGIHGTIAAVTDNTVFLKVSDNTKIEINRINIAEVLDPDKKT